MLYHLFICRHAEAPALHHPQQDFDRPLSNTGHLEAMQAGDWLRQHQYTPDIIWCSSAQRTLSTARIIADILVYNQNNIQAMEQIYNASAASLLAVITRLSPTKSSALVVGHNPGVSHLIELLSGRDVGYVPPGSVHRLWFEMANWLELYAALSLGYETNCK